MKSWANATKEGRELKMQTLAVSGDLQNHPKKNFFKGLNLIPAVAMIGRGHDP